jgi:cytochrome c-type biogenesis protein CcmF
MWGYELEYLGERLQPRNYSSFINKSDVNATADPDFVIADKTITLDNQTLKEGDTIFVEGENTFYEIEFRKGSQKFSLFPRAQINPAMGGLLASPDIFKTVRADLYTHVSSVMNPTEDGSEWSELEELRTQLGKEFFANDYVAKVESINRLTKIGNAVLEGEDIAVVAVIKVSGEKGDYIAKPIFLIKEKMVGRIPDDVYDLGLRFTFMNIHPETNEFTLGINTRQKNWVVIKALEKPYINILWIGTLLLMAGFSIAMIRRFREFSKMKAKGLE